MTRFKGRVAIVTGGSQGIGQAVAERLAGEGARVAVVARHEDTVEEAVRDLCTLGAEAARIVADVADEADTKRYVAETLQAVGRVDVLVNNAATIEIASLLDTSIEAWDRVLAVNARGVFLGCREVARQLIDQGTGGRIVNVASGAGRQGGPSISAYAASKAAVIGLPQSIAVELAPHGITVNACCPGHVTTTRMWDHIDTEFARISGTATGETRDSVVNDVPLARSGRPDEIASVVAFLASDDASFMTGESVVVDGGCCATERAPGRLPGGDRLRRDQQPVEHQVRPFDVLLPVTEREGEVAGEERVDPEPAELAQRRDQRLDGAVMDVLQEDRAPVEHHVTREQAPPSAVVEQEGKMAAGVPRGLDAFRPRAEARAAERVLRLACGDVRPGRGADRTRRRLEELRRMIGSFRANRDFCVAALREMPGLPVPDPHGAFYVFPRIDGLDDSFAFCGRLLVEQRVGLAPGSAFGAGGEGSVRLCYAAERSILEPGLERLDGFLRAG